MLKIVGKTESLTSRRGRNEMRSTVSTTLTEDQIEFLRRYGLQILHVRHLVDTAGRPEGRGR